MKCEALSATKINMITTCPKQYHYRYDMHKKSPSDPIYFLYGRLVHGALNHLADYPVDENIEQSIQNALKENLQTVPTTELIGKVREAIQTWFTPEKFKGKVLMKEEMVSICLTCGKQVEKFANKCKHCNTAFGNDGLRYDSVIDLAREVDSTTVKITDYKTGGQYFTTSDLEDSPQMLGYGLVSKVIFPQYTNFILNIEQIDRNMSTEIKIGHKELIEYINYLKSLQESIRNISKPIANVSPDNCTYCDYQHLCQEFKLFIEEDLQFDMKTIMDTGMDELLMTIQSFSMKRKYFEEKEKKMKAWLIAQLQKTNVKGFEKFGYKVSMVEPMMTEYDVNTILELIPKDKLPECLSVRKGKVDKVLKYSKRIKPSTKMMIYETSRKIPRKPWLKIKEAKKK